MKTWMKLAGGALLLAAGLYFYRKLIPVYRVEAKSELVMLGDLDGDHRWTNRDGHLLDAFLADPFSYPERFARRMDLNQNGRLDDEDLILFRALVAEPDPYAAGRAAMERAAPFPRPREFYRYESTSSYRPRPLWSLPPPNPVPALQWMDAIGPASSHGTYADALQADLYNEAVRFKEAYRKRGPGLLPLESEHAREKLARCRALFVQGSSFDLLLELTALVEDVETLRAAPSQEGSIRYLKFRDHLRGLLSSPLFDRFKNGEATWQEILRAMERDLQADLGFEYQLASLPPARNLTNLENYLQRVEWQYYKSSTKAEDFLHLLEYAQKDPRYLRAVSRTTRKHADSSLGNHNLPMVLLFREALRIKGGDKKRAVGLLDEAIRIPFAWIKSIPREKLPRSLALDNFLLPGNKEDGSDKSRHWNVFGGICLYKSPEEALDLALKREMKDLRESGYSVDGMTEFIRDMIANLNGMYHVVVMDPGLLPRSGVPVAGS